jgi:hypothetical protein
MRHSWFFLLVCFAIPAFAQQSTPRAEVFGGYSYLDADTNNLVPRQGLNGWEVSFSGNVNRWFAVEAAGSGYYKSYLIPVPPCVIDSLLECTLSARVSDYAFVAGPRLNYRPVFIHALFGVDRLTGSLSGLVGVLSPISASQDSFAGAIGGGVEQPIAHHLAIEASVDYAFSRHNIFGGPAVTQNNVRLAGGLVYRFGGLSSHQPSVASEPTRTAWIPVPELGVQVIVIAGTGLEIVQLSSSGPAALSGLHVGDVISSVAGTAVRTPGDLSAAVAQQKTRFKIGFLIHGQWQSETNVIPGSH